VDEGVLDSTKPPQAYFIYLPPCYDEKTDKRYPVLYLLHGQTYTANQWIRLGAVNVLDGLILSGETQPFIVVFPDDRYWNLPPGAGFGQSLAISSHTLTQLSAAFRSKTTAPLERKQGRLGFSAGFHPLGFVQLIGLHSLAVLQASSKIDDWIADIPPSLHPSVFMDIGNDDQELSMARSIEAQFNEIGLSHEWHRYRGAHTEEYWSAHVTEYIEWYAEQWDVP
jgi:hypothetical protein